MTDFETAPTTEYFPAARGDEPTLPWFPLDDATEAAREFGHEEPTRAERPGARR